VSQESIVLLDVSTPAAPTFVNAEETPQWSMQVASANGVAFLAEWGFFSAYAASGAEAPHLELSRDEVYLSPEGASEIVRIQNLGAADLEISGARVWSGAADLDAGSRLADDRVQLRVSDDLLPSGATAELEIQFSGGEALEASLCLESNDPDGSRSFVALSVGESGTGVALGNDAPDFVLQDLDGNSHRLSEQLGHPVVLVYFATW
jgi:hypothetical protein